MRVLDGTFSIAEITNKQKETQHLSLSVFQETHIPFFFKNHTLIHKTPTYDCVQVERAWEGTLTVSMAAITHTPFIQVTIVLLQKNF